MSRRRPYIHPRRIVFLGCEGNSEYGYGALLARMAQGVPSVSLAIQPVHLQPGAGDPLELVERALQKIRESEYRRSRFAIRAVLIDQGTSSKTSAAIRRAAAVGLHIVWQTPDHEALLLRHLPGCQSLRPPAGDSMRQLLRHWPEYSKGMSATRLMAKIGMSEIRQACSVEPELYRFLKLVGLI